MEKKILFLTGTRADYGKLKSLMEKVQNEFNVYIFVTGMHMLKKFGSTYNEIEKDGFRNIYKYINQSVQTPMDLALSNTIVGLSNYVHELDPDMIVVHGDRLEALAGAIVGAFNNITVSHIEGGEVSGTIDESIRHAITKFSHFHFVANEEAKKRVMQLGEKEEHIFIIGSPDIDVMISKNLPSIDEVKSRYEITYDNYAVLIYHPVTTESDAQAKENAIGLVNAIIKSNYNYVAIYPNNDRGSDIILEQYNRFENLQNIRMFPSIRFEYFLTLLKNASFIIGNSSAGIREASVYGIPTINIGNRQHGRINDVKKGMINVGNETSDILKAIYDIQYVELEENSFFGEGNSDQLFLNVLKDDRIWNLDVQKYFIDFNGVK